MSYYKKTTLFFIHFFVVIFVYSQTSINKSNTQIADSLDNLGNYNEAVKFRSFALNESNHTSDYVKYLNVKWQFSKSCFYERIGGLENHKKALVHSIKGREILNGMDNPSTNLKQLLANRIYHQYGYVQNWKMAHLEAIENLKIRLDSFPEYNKQTLLIIDDLGYINTKLGDYSNALKYYDKSLQLYLKYQPQNKRDLAMNYSLMSKNYKMLGMRKKELATLLELEKLWTQIPDKINFPLFGCYEKLSHWYMYYGNYTLAETYLNKQERIIDSVKFKKSEFKVKRRKNYLNLYRNYIELNLKKKDYDNVRKYIALSEHELIESKRVYIEDIFHEASIYFYKSKLPELSSKESIELIKKAILLVNTYKDKFFLDATQYQIDLFEKYKALGLYDQAENTLKKIINSTPSGNTQKLFFLYSNYGDLLNKNNQFDLAESTFKKALNFYILKGEPIKKIGQTNMDNIKPVYSFESINGILMAANFSYERYLNTSKINDLNTAQNLFFLASKMFENMYLGERYNDYLFETFKVIEKGLLNVIEHQTSKLNIDRTIVAIEKNASKLTWSKFMYNKEKPNLNIPDSTLLKENEIKTLINHYQNELFNNIKSQKLETDTLKNRISSLNLDLDKLRKSIKLKYNNYFKRNYEAFNIEAFRSTLDRDELVLKYIFSDDNLYCVLITKFHNEVQLIPDSKLLKKQVTEYINSLSTFNSNQSEFPKKLNALILPILEKNQKSKITIIPDGILNYLPFETLLFNSNKLKDYTLSYATSLTLLNEQRNIPVQNKNLNMGVFSSTNKANNELPSAQKETHSILDYFNGKLFNNISKTTFLKEVSEYNILHLAMHSQINNENPDLSRLDFNDDHLLISELYNESFNAQLVVLSACETGSGQIENGEGVQSISRAFTYTGIPSTVVSLWKVDDEATSKIMTQFYYHLKNGNSKAQALRNAKLDYLNMTEEVALRHPYYWAGFVIYGNTSPLVSNHNNFYWYLGVVGLIVILMVFRKKLYFFK